MREGAPEPQHSSLDEICACLYSRDGHPLHRFQRHGQPLSHGGNEHQHKERDQQHAQGCAGQHRPARQPDGHHQPAGRPEPRFRDDPSGQLQLRQPHGCAADAQRLLGDRPVLSGHLLLPAESAGGGVHHQRHLRREGLPHLLGWENRAVADAQPDDRRAAMSGLVHARTEHGWPHRPG